jgi:hypothetical protein
MPLTVFGAKGVPAMRRERIEAAVEAGGAGAKRSGASRRAIASPCLRRSAPKA